MKRYRWAKYLVGFLLILAVSCIEDYLPPEIQAPAGYLVVDGYMSAGESESMVALFRTQNLADTGNPAVELNAQVFIENQQNEIQLFKDQGNGQYSLPDTELNNNEQYRLRIRTADGKEYVSAYVSLRSTPPIDSVSWKLEREGLQIYVNTHDEQNNSWYYRWEYEETWQFTSAFESKFDYVNEQLVPRAENIYTCWQTQPSTNILIGSSRRLSQDVIREQPIVFLPSDSPKLGIRYSILVKQSAISKEAYEYYQKLEKNTENLGTLFDPQPSQLTGNIGCISDPSEVVIGYFDVVTRQSKRLFIDNSQLPDWTTNTGYEACQADTVDIETPRLPDEPPVIPNGYMFIERRLYIKVFNDRGDIINRPTIGAVISPAACVDCNLKGTNVKPDFWE